MSVINEYTEWLVLHHSIWINEAITAWKVFKYGVISGPYFPAFGLNTGKYGPEITPYLDTFHAVNLYPSLDLLVFRQHQKDAWNLFKVSDKDTRIILLVSTMLFT